GASTPVASSLASDAEQLLDHVVGDADDLRGGLEPALDQDQIAELAAQVDVAGFELAAQDGPDAGVLGTEILPLAEAGISEQGLAALLERLRIAEVGERDRADVLLLLVGVSDLERAALGDLQRLDRPHRMAGDLGRVERVERARRERRHAAGEIEGH